VLLVLLAFLGGVLTVLSPCVLPVLPVLLSGTVGGPSRPRGIITGFVGVFVLVTLFLSVLVSRLHVDPAALRWGATALLFVFGVTLAVPGLQRRFEAVAAVAVPQRTVGDGNGFLGGVLVGSTLGLVWTPCVGPILAGVTTLALSGTVTAMAFTVTLAYAVGVAVPMFGVMQGGRTLLARVPALMGNLGRLQRGFGVLLAGFAVAMVFGLDRSLQTLIVDRVPYVQQLTFLEDGQGVQQQIDQRLR